MQCCSENAQGRIQSKNMNKSRIWDVPMVWVGENQSVIAELKGLEKKE
ncbi:MAG: hypothetical protein ACP5U0_09110 [Caldisphaera sp.]